MLQTFAVYAVILVVITVIIWSIAHRVRRTSRMADMEGYWDSFNHIQGCEQALEYFRDGIHVSHMYGVIFSDIGCPNEATFRAAAIHSLERFMDDMGQKYDSAVALGDQDKMSNTNLRILRARANLARFRMMDMTEEERAKAGNTFLTMPATKVD